MIAVQVGLTFAQARQSFALVPHSGLLVLAYDQAADEVEARLFLLQLRRDQPVMSAVRLAWNRPETRREDALRL